METRPCTASFAFIIRQQCTVCHVGFSDGNVIVSHCVCACVSARIANLIGETLSNEHWNRPHFANYALAEKPREGSAMRKQKGITCPSRKWFPTVGVHLRQCDNTIKWDYVSIIGRSSRSRSCGSAGAVGGITKKENYKQIGRKNGKRKIPSENI